MKSLSFLVLMAATVVPSGLDSVPSNSVDDADWQLIFEDDFNGSDLDTGVWRIATGPRRHAVNTPSAISVADGQLTITTHTEGGTHYTGFIGTSPNFLSTFGYWEARIKFDSASGMWSAFWLQSPTMGNPIGDAATAGAEIDIVEHRLRDSAGTNISNRAAHNVHWDGYGASHRSVGTVTTNPGPEPLQGNFHTYGVLWTPARYEFYIDGILRWSTTQGISHRSEFIYLTSEVQNNSWAGPIPAGGYGSLDTSNVKMTVDWVRVWERPLYGQDIGSVQLPGSDALDEFGTWTVQGAGDIWGTSDRCRFVYLPMRGDGMIFAQVTAIDHPDLVAKAGLMIRETLSGNAKRVAVILNAGGNVSFLTRTATGGATTAPATLPGVVAPYGLWLERVGNTFTAWGTADYVNWDWIWSEEIPMADRVYIGLAVANHNSSASVNTAWFDNVFTSIGR